MMNNSSESAKTGLVEAQRFLLSQSREFIIRAWLLEFLEREKAVSFIQSQGLYADYVRERQFK